MSSRTQKLLIIHFIMSLLCINTTLSVCSNLIKYCNNECFINEYYNNECYCKCITTDNEQCPTFMFRVILISILALFLVIIIILSYCCIKKKPKLNTVMNHRITAD